MDSICNFGGPFGTESVILDAKLAILGTKLATLDAKLAVLAAKLAVRAAKLAVSNERLAPLGCFSVLPSALQARTLLRAAFEASFCSMSGRSQEARSLKFVRPRSVS